MEVFSNKTLAEKNHENLEEAMRQKLHRLSGKESSQSFEFDVDSVAVCGQHIYIASNSPDPKAVPANAKTKAVLWRYSVYDGGTEKFCELESEVDLMRSVISANSIFVACKDGKVGTIDIIRRIVQLPFQVMDRLLKIVVKPMQSKVYYLANNAVSVLKIKGLQLTKKDLFKFDAQIMNFDVFVSENSLLLLTDRWELLVFDMTSGALWKAKHLTGPVLGLQYDDITSKIAVVYPNGFYIYDFSAANDDQQRSRAYSPDPTDAKLSVSKMLSETMRSFRSKNDIPKTSRAYLKDESQALIIDRSVKDHDDSNPTLESDGPDIPFIQTTDAVPRKYSHKHAEFSKDVHWRSMPSTIRVVFHCQV
jgi:hypothetical protein